MSAYPKHMILRTLIFFTILLVLARLISLLADPNMTRTYYYNRQIEQFFASKAGILVLGDSHVAEIIQSDSDIFNFAAGNESISEFYAKLLLALKNGKKFNYIVLQCDYHMFGEFKLTNNNLNYLASHLDPKTFLNAYPRYNIIDYLYYRIGNYFTIFNTGNSLAYRARFNTERIRKNADFLKHGEGDTSGARMGFLAKALWWKDATPERKMLEIQDRVMTQFSDSISEDLVKVYAEIVRTAQANNIKVIGITYPLAPEFRQVLPKPYINRIEQIFDSMHFYKRYNYCAFTDNGLYFLNQDHMNGLGGDLFFANLKETLQRDGILNE